MKKIVVFLLVASFMLSLAACGEAKGETLYMEPEVSQMKAICELSVMDCYYHNVAKFMQEDAEGALWWQKDKHFWIEYSGVVKLGIDVALVTVEVSDTEITITIPEAKVLDCKVDSASLNKDSFIVAQDSADIEASDEIAAFESAQAQLKETASNDKALLANAQRRAQSLLEDYVKNIGNAVGKSYTIKWVYLDAEGNPLGTSSFSTTEQTEETTA